MQISSNALKLYAVTDRTWLKENQTLADAVEKAILGGVTIVQLREKNSDFEEQLSLALELKKVCKKYNIPLIINDSVELTLKSGADGVHLGQSDGDIKNARTILGDSAIIGATAHNVHEAYAAFKAGADYLGCGAVFGSYTKNNTVPLSFDELKKICDKVPIPVAAIGGINSDNIFKLKGTGINGAAVVSAIFAENDIQSAAAALKKSILEITGD